MIKLFRNILMPSYKRILFFYCLLLSIVPVIALGLISSHIAANSIQEEVNLRHETVLNQIEYKMNSFFQKMVMSSLLISSNPTIEDTFEVGPSMRYLDLSLNMIRQLSDYRVTSDFAFDVSLIYTDFDRVYSNIYGLIPMEEFPYTHILNQVEMGYNNFHVIPPGRYPNQNDMLLIRRVPITSSPSKGFMVMHVNTKELTDFLKQLNMESSWKTVILDETGRIVLSNDPGEIGTVFSYSSLHHDSSVRSGIHQGELEVHGEPYRYSSVTSKFNNWTYITFTPMAELTEKSNQIKQASWLIVLFIVGIWLVIIAMASNRMYFPVQKLLAKLPKEAQADPGRDGLQVLDSFMIQTVKANQELLRKLKVQTPYILEHFYQKLLLGDLKPSDLEREENQPFVSLKGPWFSVCVIEMDQYYKFMNTYSGSDASLIYYALRNILEEICQEYHLRVTVTSLPKQIVAIIEMEMGHNQQLHIVQQALDNYRNKVEQHLKCTVTAAISSFRKGLSEIHLSYEEAVGLMNYRLLLGHNRTILYQSIKPSLKQSGLNLVELQKEIAAAVVEMNADLAKEKLSKMIQAVPNLVKESETVFSLFVYILGEITSLMQESGYNPQEIIDEDVYRQLYQFDSLKDIEEWFGNQVCIEIIRRLEEAEVSERAKLVQQISHYARKHYEEGLSLKQIADELGMSPSQLSRIFKEEMKLSFRDHALHVRMEKAKEWLVYTDMPIKQIASRLSYTTVQNFTRSFKQMTGIPPAAYRERYRKQNQTESGG